MQEAKVLLTAEHDEHLIDGLLRAGSLSGPYRRRFLLGQRMGHVVGRLPAFSLENIDSFIAAMYADRRMK